MNKFLKALSVGLILTISPFILNANPIPFLPFTIFNNTPQHGTENRPIFILFFKKNRGDGINPQVGWPMDQKNIEEHGYSMDKINYTIPLTCDYPGKRSKPTYSTMNIVVNIINNKIMINGECCIGSQCIVPWGWRLNYSDSIRLVTPYMVN